jgi:hypothetical protein
MITAACPATSYIHNQALISTAMCCDLENVACGAVRHHLVGRLRPHAIQALSAEHAGQQLLQGIPARPGAGHHAVAKSGRVTIMLSMDFDYPTHGYLMEIGMSELPGSEGQH